MDEASKTPAALGEAEPKAISEDTRVADGVGSRFRAEGGSEVLTFG